MAGTAMSRRAATCTATCCRRDPKGQVGAGLGHHHLGGYGHPDPAHRQITETGQKLRSTASPSSSCSRPDTEAPAEMHWFIEELKAI